MPFRRQPDGNYRSESGRKYTPSQVRLYGMTDGFKHMEKAKRVRRRRPSGGKSKH